MPEQLRVLSGSRRRGPKPIPDTSGKAPEPLPKCPSYLTTRARAEWRRIAPELHRTGRLTVLDVTALAAYCIAVATYLDAEELIAKDGLVLRSSRGDYVKNPLVSVSRAAMVEARALAREFGLTALSRDRVATRDTTETVVDELERFLRS